MKQLTNAQFHNFETENIFVGTFTGEKMLREEDSKTDKTQKKGDLMGYKFDSEDGLEVIVGGASTVVQVMEPEVGKGDPIVKGTIIGFEFKGQGITSNKRKFNKFGIIQFDSYEEAAEYYASHK